MPIVQGCIERHVTDYVLLANDGKKYSIPIPLLEQQRIKGAVIDGENKVCSLDDYEWVQIDSPYYAFRTRALWQGEVVLNEELANPYKGLEGLCETLMLKKERCVFK